VLNVTQCLAGIDGLIGDYKYVIEKSSVLNPFEKVSNAAVEEYGKHVGAIVKDIALALIGVGAAKVIKVLSKTKIGAKFAKTLEKFDGGLKKLAKDNKGSVDLDAFGKGASNVKLLPEPKAPKTGKPSKKTVDRNSGKEVGRFIANEKGNVMIEPNWIIFAL